MGFWFLIMSGRQDSNLATFWSQTRRASQLRHAPRGSIARIVVSYQVRPAAAIVPRAGLLFSRPQEIPQPQPENDPQGGQRLMVVDLGAALAAVDEDDRRLAETGASRARRQRISSWKE